VVGRDIRVVDYDDQVLLMMQRRKRKTKWAQGKCITIGTILGFVIKTL
jgi:hypothetical protein